ncbi:MAG: tetratricopeptide repeat protein [Gammaproteobacteria bacterium]|nr:tetratricopeptide repeat protein [Gammaproteobacteria bacterium]
MSPLPKYPKKIRRLFDSALEYEKSGRPGNASEVCRKILRLAPRHEKTLLLLNRIAMQSGDYALSISLMEKAVKINPRNPEYHYNLGLAYNSMGKIKEALSCMKHATSVKLDYVAAWVGLGNIMFSDNRLDEAKQYYSKAIQLSPDNPSMHYNIGLLNRRLGDLDGSSISFQRTLSINPEFIQAYIELGNNCQQKGEFDEAEKYFRIVLERDPANAVACNGLGYCMQLKGELEQAYDLFNKAILLQSEYSSALTNIGNIFQLRGFPDEAINFYRKALSYSPGDMNTFQNLLGTMNYTNRFSPSEIYAEHVEFYNRVKSGLSVGSLELFSPRDPDKRLKVGYVSPDFRGHAVSRFIEPVMSCHNRNKFEIFSYYNFSYSDEVTERLIEHCDHWVNISNFSD